MRLIPHGSRNYDLNLLSSRESGHTVMRSKFTVQPNIFKMLFDILCRQRTDIETGSLCDLQVNSLDCFFPSHLLQDLGREIFSRVNSGSCITDFVFVFLRLVLFSSSDQFDNDLLDLADLSCCVIGKLDFVWGLLKLFFFGGENHRYLDERFLVLSLVGISPSDVFIWRLVQVTFNVVESVLSNVGDTSVRVLPDFSLLWFNISNKNLDHGRLSSSILTNTGDTGTEGHLDGDVEKGWFGILWVCESNIGDLHESFSLGLDSLNWSGLRELEL
mmetsp:Transcript_14675/g.22361  ORF Transcript_14675/g.22361 Transcript_14675/m.22361 type:complete len:273 (-) Transcript_14675:1957-2775(-)